MTEGVEDISENLEPEYAPDPRSFRQILVGILLIGGSPLLWQVGVGMEPAAIEIWKQLFPVAPFGHYVPLILPAELVESLDVVSVKHYLGDESPNNMGVFLAFSAPLFCVIGAIHIACGAIWTAAESLRAA